jgi:hypothetical protein
MLALPYHDDAIITSGKPCVHFLCFFNLWQVEKVPIPESTAYLKKEIPSTF